MKRTLHRMTFMVACLLCCVGASALPANPLAFTVTQPDGTSLVLKVCGDEYYHYYTTEDGIPVTLCEDGYYRYTTLDAHNRIVASDKIVGTAYPSMSDDKPMIMARHKELYKINKAQRTIDLQGEEPSMRRVAKKAAAGNGVVKGIIVLAEFQDQKFTISQSDVYDRMNKEGFTDEYGSIGSARDYFIAQSYGQFQPEFNVVGPVTLSQNMAYYGGNEDQARDVRPDVMVSEACELASQQGLVDMSDYDSNGDGWVDLVYVIYAGYPESSGAPAETIWPHAWYIYRGAGRTVEVDGVQLDAYACSSEFCGNSGAQPDGIGSFCHEYSHTLGLPDWYDIDYSGAMGMSWWSLMDSGCYAGNGYVPVGYNAYERAFCGWLDFNELTSQCSITMPYLNSDKTAAYKVTSADKNQYITLETRCREGWDTYLPAEGMMVIAVDYDQYAWNRNGPNDDPMRQRFRLIPADDNWSNDDLYGDLYPYKGNTSLTSTSSPMMKVYNTTIKNKPITNIAFTNGVTTFDFMQDAGNGDSGDYTFITPGKYTWSYEFDSRGTEIFTSETTFAAGEQFPLSDIFSGADGMVGTQWSISGLFDGNAICDELHAARAITYTTSTESGSLVEVLQFIDIQNTDYYYYASVGKAYMYDTDDNLVVVDLYLADISGNSILHPTFVAYSEDELVFDGTQLVLFYSYEGGAYLYDYIHNVTINRSSDNPGEAVSPLVGTYSAYAKSAYEGYPDEEWRVSITQDAYDADKVWIQPIIAPFGGLDADEISPVYAYVDEANSTLTLPLGQNLYGGPREYYNIVVASLDNNSQPLISGEIVVPYYISDDNLTFTIDFLGAGDLNDEAGWWYQALVNLSFTKPHSNSGDDPQQEAPTFLAGAYDAFAESAFSGYPDEEWAVNITLDEEMADKVWIHPVCMFGDLPVEYINPVYAIYNEEDATLTMPLGQVLYEDSDFRMIIATTTDGENKDMSGDLTMYIHRANEGVEITFADDCILGVGNINANEWWYQAIIRVVFTKTTTDKRTVVIYDDVAEYTNTDETLYDELTYVRNFDNTDWQTWYVPFEVAYETLATEFEVAYLNNVHQYDKDNNGVVDITELEAIKVKDGILRANYPYIVRAITPGEKEVVVEDAILYPTEENTYDCSSMMHRYYFAGIYGTMTGDMLNEYGVYTLQDNMLSVPDSNGSSLGAFRWFMYIEDRGTVTRPQQIVLRVADNLTDVEDVVGDNSDAPVEYYDLSGRRVEHPTSGIYIMKQGDIVRKVVVNER